MPSKNSKFTLLTLYTGSILLLGFTICLTLLLGYIIYTEIDNFDKTINKENNYSSTPPAPKIMDAQEIQGKNKRLAMGDREYNNMRQQQAQIIEGKEQEIRIAYFTNNVLPIVPRIGTPEDLIKTIIESVASDNYDLFSNATVAQTVQNSPQSVLESKQKKFQELKLLKLETLGKDYKIEEIDYRTYKVLWEDNKTSFQIQTYKVDNDYKGQKLNYYLFEVNGF